MTTDIENTPINVHSDQKLNADGHIFRAKKIVLGNPKHWNHVSLETYFFI